MSRRILSKLFIILMTAVITAGSSYGYAETEQSLQTTVQSAVAIEKLTTSKEDGTVDAQTGILTTVLKSDFLIQTNESDDDYDFVVTSIVNTEDDGAISAYGPNKTILFGHTGILPKRSAVEDARGGGNNNDNVIAYPVSCSITQPMTVEFKLNHGSYGDCFVVKVNSETGGNGTLTHSIDSNPVTGTYNITQDQAGTYKSTVYFTAIKK